MDVNDDELYEKQGIFSGEKMQTMKEEKDSNIRLDLIDKMLSMRQVGQSSNAGMVPRKAKADGFTKSGERRIRRQCG